ncbi:succinyl-diaminopimelate desuccinylase [Candidatus Nitrosoglobus terrae]|uniref:Succinyl-diaminopimelate desuccinylase n=1 Tax=Candidatus Nitrosoglobus terrae TaxID=1630141 RepID=A0A1Q2SNF7_9GAMM|nr:succinyl-diaminopimelate desuccinylase [Candidatus Nitrosoglobus terrae]BAW80660.1 succinyl-diaminopimelate desuccinylase [Candidatus Nitrosoglobus terrae]
MSATLDLTKKLIGCASVTPNDAGCQTILAQRLMAIGFQAEPMPFGEVENIWLRRGQKAPLFVFAGHTDVVPSGPQNKWLTDPFIPKIHDGMLYGRGAADMKGGLAAMITASEQFITTHPDHLGSIAFLITSDEEGPAIDGTARVVEILEARGEKIDYCLIGEPTSYLQVGDRVKNGRRGSLNGRLTIQGIQGHIAYPQLADNPIHHFAPALVALCATEWDQGNKDFPPTSFQISNIHSGTGAANVIPGELEVLFNFRYSTEVTYQQLQERTAEILSQYDLKYKIDWALSGKPFQTKEGKLIIAVSQAIKDITGLKTDLSTTGGTSDGRFIAPTGAQVIELGLVNATIHKIDEHIAIADLDKLSQIYHRILEILLAH